LIVVSDTSPILNLSAVGQLKLLKQLYREVVIPPAVATELRANGVEYRGEKWLAVMTPASRELVDQLSHRLDPGEAEAIAVAVELHANRILIDERRARRVAAEFNLQAVGLLGVLVEAKQKGYLQECKSVLDEMIQVAGFWIGDRLYERFLEEIGENG
jgi:uncharacterized protein